MKARILLVDDHPVFRDGLAAFLTQNGSYEVAGTVGSVGAAERILTHEHEHNHPIDLVLLDVTLGTDNSIIELPRLRAVSPRSTIVMLSMHGSPAIVRSALRGGASGFLNKACAGPEIVTALKAIQRGEVFIDPTLREILLLSEEDEEKTVSTTERYERLSAREKEVFRELALGRKPRRIAQQLGIAKRTADAHRYHIMQKLEADSLAGLVRIAVELGVIDHSQTE